MAFSSIPILDLALAREETTKPAFLDALRNALLDVGFLYIKNTGIDEKLVQDVIEQGKAFFDLPQEKKLLIQMKNEKSFLGYNLLGNETTAHKTDWREQIDLSTPHPIPTVPPQPRYANLLAPNQWPSPTDLPFFRPTYESYITAMSHLSTQFTSWIAEALHLPPTAFDRFFDADQQHKLKIVKYPDLASLPGTAAPPQQGNGSTDAIVGQGVGPHKDSMLTSYLLQVPPHTGLQAQNLEGDWIDCPPLPGTLVVAIGQGLEALTHGVCKSTTHRVLSPRAGLGPRYSVPFFQGVSYDATFESVAIPDTISKMKEERAATAAAVVGARGETQKKDDVEFTFTKGRWGHLGEATLMNRIKSHPDVGERWYPDLLSEIREEQAREGIAGAKMAQEGEDGDLEGSRPQMENQA